MVLVPLQAEGTATVNHGNVKVREVCLSVNVILEDEMD